MRAKICCIGFYTTTIRIYHLYCVFKLGNGEMYMDALNQLLNCMLSMWMKYSLSIMMQALYIPSQNAV